MDLLTLHVEVWRYLANIAAGVIHDDFDPGEILDTGDMVDEDVESILHLLLAIKPTSWVLGVD